MGLASMLVVLVLSVFAPTISGAADDAARCQSAFVHRGTHLFDGITDVTARCYADHLRRVQGPSDEGCPSTDDFDAIAALEANTLARIDGKCAAPIGTSGLCTEFAGEEALDLVNGVFGGSTAFVSDGAARRCRTALGGLSVRLAEMKARVLRRCNEGAVRGLAGYGPLGPTCEMPSGTQAAIADAEARARARIAGKCGALDPQTDLALGAACPGAPDCEFAIDTLPELIDCVACVANAEVEQLSRGLAALPLDATTSCSVGQVFYFLDLLDDDLRDLAACEDRILDGNGTGPCPDAETTDDLAVNESRYGARLAALCADPPLPAGIALVSAEFLTDTLYPTHAEETDDHVKRCRTEIGRSVTLSSGNARRQLRALRTCYTQSLCGQTSGNCPDSEAAASIAHAAASAASGITARCSAYTPASLGFGTCPSIGTCGAPLTTIPELITCLQCVTDELAAEVTGSAIP